MNKLVLSLSLSLSLSVEKVVFWGVHALREGSLSSQGNNFNQPTNQPTNRERERERERTREREKREKEKKREREERVGRFSEETTKKKRLCDFIPFSPLQNETKSHRLSIARQRVCAFFETPSE